MKTGVLIGRFQIDVPTYAHHVLFQHVRNNNDQVVVIIGEAPVPLTDRNPLTYGMRRNMLENEFVGMGKKVFFFTVMDNASDEQWSRDVDHICAQFMNVTLYGARDSFIPHYRGVYPTEIVLFNFEGISATNVRKKLAKIPGTSEDFRHGVIYAVENRFPVAYPTIDIAVLRPSKDGAEVLLGRKKGSTKWQFIGGFVDPQDATMEAAASRELQEEAKGIFTHELEYVCSAKVEDFRYRGTKDGIMTTFFKTYILGGNPIANDDIEELCWYKLNEDTLWYVADYHKHLFNELLKNIKSVVV